MGLKLHTLIGESCSYHVSKCCIVIAPFVKYCKFSTPYVFLRRQITLPNLKLITHTHNVPFISCDGKWRFLNPALKMMWVNLVHNDSKLISRVSWWGQMNVLNPAFSHVVLLVLSDFKLIPRIVDVCVLWCQLKVLNFAFSYGVELFQSDCPTSMISCCHYHSIQLNVNLVG